MAAINLGEEEKIYEDLFEQAIAAVEGKEEAKKLLAQPEEELEGFTEEELEVAE